MTIDMCLRIGAIGIPLVGALAMWRWGTKFPHAQRHLVVSILGITGLIGLTLFLLNRYYACILAFGRRNCLFDGLATLSLFLLSILLTRWCIALRGENKEQDYSLVLLLGSAWAGMGLTQNFFVFLGSASLFVLAADQWLRRRGITARFLVLRDDYQDDVK